MASYQDSNDLADLPNLIRVLGVHLRFLPPDRRGNCPQKAADAPLSPVKGVESVVVRFVALECYIFMRVSTPLW